MEHQQGDTAAMRAQAASARQSAEGLERLADRLERRVEGLVYDGPAALRFRGAMTERIDQTRRAAARLHEVADGAERATARTDRAGGAIGG